MDAVKTQAERTVERIRRAEKALDSYQTLLRESGPLGTDLATDLIADVLHWVYDHLKDPDITETTHVADVAADHFAYEIMHPDEEC